MLVASRIFVADAHLGCPKNVHMPSDVVVEAKTGFAIMFIGTLIQATFSFDQALQACYRLGLIYTDADT
jgi:hypothetical protein